MKLSLSALSLSAVFVAVLLVTSFPIQTANAVTSSVSLSAGALAFDVYNNGNKVFVMKAGSPPTVEVFNAVTLVSIANITGLSGTSVADSETQPIAIDETNGWLYVATRSGAGANYISKINANTNTFVSTITLSADCRVTSMQVYNGLLYAAQYNGGCDANGQVTIYNSGLTALATVTLGFSGGTIVAGSCVDTGNGLLFVIGSGGAGTTQSITKFNLLTNTVVNTLSLGTSASARDCQVADGGVYAYVSMGSAGSVNRITINGVSGVMSSASAVTGLSAPTDFAYDADDGILYLVATGSNNVHAYGVNASTGALTHIVSYTGEATLVGSDFFNGGLFFVSTTGNHLFKVVGSASSSSPECYDIDTDGVIDGCLEDLDGDGISDLSYDDIPPLVGPITESAPALLTALTGIEGTAAATLLGLVPPMAVMVLLGGLQGKAKVDLPVMVYGLGFMIGMGVSVALAWLEPWWIVVGILGFAVSFAGKIKGLF